MGDGTLLSVGRAIVLASMAFALVGIALSLASYSTQDISISDADYSTHTRAFCSSKGDMLYCEDKLVMESNGKERITENSRVTGAAFVETF